MKGYRNVNLIWTWLNDANSSEGSGISKAYSVHRLASIVTVGKKGLCSFQVRLLWRDIYSSLTRGGIELFARRDLDL